MHSGKKGAGVEADGTQNPQHEPVEFEAVAAPPLRNELIEDNLGIKIDPVSGQDVEVLEWDGEELSVVERDQTKSVGVGSAGQPHPPEIGFELVATEKLIHGERILTGYRP